MLLPELRSLAAELGIKGTSGMRKGDLIDVIRAHQHGGAPKAAAKAPGSGNPAADNPGADKQAAEKPVAEKPAANGPADKPVEAKNERPSAESSQAKAGSGEKPASEDKPAVNNEGEGNRGRNRQRNRDNSHRDNSNRDNSNRDNNNRDNSNRNQGEKNQDSGEKSGPDSKNPENRNSGNQHSGNKGQGNQNQGAQNRGGDDEDGEGGGRRRGRRFRERRRGRDREGGGNQGDPQVNEGDVLAPVAGILDVLDNYAFVRTSGYLAGPNDVYVSMNMVRRNNLRRGDAITGAVKVPRDGDNPNNQRQKFNPLVRLDTVNGTDVESARKRPDFTKLTPLYPNQRLRLETTPERLSTRVIDLMMPIGKGQRALIVSPPKAGKTTILQDIANAISTNNPECHLMVVLVDERPEEVTDMQRSVKGEVIASTFDRPPSDHTSVAELAIERAKRLVESGMDVVVLLDSITRLGRAYNNASPASGRILSGGVDSQALYPPKRFLGAARNIENGGSLTIIASALVETGSTGDTVIFEEFKGTGNAELKLDRKIAERRVFPAVDVNMSSTRKDELLLSPDEFAIVHKLRRLLAGLDSQAAIDLLIAQLKKTRSNVEFLMQVSKNAPGVAGD